MNTMHCCLIIVLAPLFGAMMAGFFRNYIGKIGAHSVTISGVLLSFMTSLYLSQQMILGQGLHYNQNVYTWASGLNGYGYDFHLGFLIDPLTCVMMVVVTFVSLLVHVYSIGYMQEDEGYGRFFSYISLFTFMMLVLVTGNNFLQLFFGWEGVGLVSYLLIGFWYQKEAANQGSMKAFLVNRVGDFGFILGLGLILAYTGSLDYNEVFHHVGTLKEQSIEMIRGHSWSLVTVIGLLLFVGAMGKSAQIPLHVWLPESMEGPTPISALIHAATMVTAGVFMLARISPLIEYSSTALSVVMVIGATGALFTGILALVMNDIKRVIAYSTLSQLGYMMVAMGASAFSAGIFHLLTHACFKALLFLAAGSVIMGMHHEQDMRKMGGLWKKMPWTYVTFLVGSLALCAIPPFAGFFSKDTIIEVAKLSKINGSAYAYVCVVLGAMVTALYTFRAFFMTFHGKPRMDDKTWSHVHESPLTVIVPLVLLAIPSLLVGYFMYEPMLFAKPSLLQSSLFVLPEHETLKHMAHEDPTPWALMSHVFGSVAYWLTLLGIFISWLLYMVYPKIPNLLAKHYALIYNILLNKYGFDAFNNWFFVRGTRALGAWFYRFGDQKLIDGILVNGTGETLFRSSLIIRRIQTGYLYDYIFVMVLGILIFLCWFVF